MIHLASWMLGICVAGPVFDPGPIQADDGDTPREIEVSRIQRHLSEVEATLRSDPPAGLDEQQAAARANALDVLHDYWTAGVFPKNRDYPDRRVPYFIDADGTACAVGHLMIASGSDELAREIATYENNDFVADIDHAGVPGWLERNGLTAEEAAWIQPSYGPCGFEVETVCGDDGRSYMCRFIAEECAMVTVVSEGPCNEDDEIVGEGICGATSESDTADTTDTSDPTDSGGSESTGGDDDGPGGDDGPSGESTGGDDDGVADTADDANSTDGGDDGDKGCRAGGAPPLSALLLLGLIGIGRRRRRQG